MNGGEETWSDVALDRRPPSRTRMALASVVVAVATVFLVLIGASLTRIEDNLRTTDVAVSGLSGRTQTMPSQLERINNSLAVVDAALRILPRDTDKVAANLAAAIVSLELVEADLSGAAPRLAGAAKDLEPAGERIGRIGTNATEAAALLEQILDRTAAMGNALAEIEGTDRTGLNGIRAKLAAINEVLRAVRGDLGDIGKTGEKVNDHLEDVCRSPAVSVRRGAQSC
ncbi:MAG: hypothetical protein ACT4QG_05790 [Sporichthyaceae bacterium]